MSSAAKKKGAVIADPKVQRIGEATARLHGLLKDLGHSRSLEQSAATMTDARDRLTFIDKSMHDASEKTLAAVEVSLPLINHNRTVLAGLVARLGETQFKEHRDLIAEISSQLDEINYNEHEIHQQLVEIMETQEFRDLAGQMVNKIVSAAVEIENILLDILKEYAPTTKDSLISKEGLLAGPSMGDKENVAGQDDVDDLLSSLGL
ncbi:MAG: protein phosphatase CheZ [Methylophilales bacterium]|nr:protein phosphatase CheZ [Methylophilales bacterium]